MAVVPEVSAVERLWIKAALQAKRQVLVRSRQKEVPGSDIYNLRGKEIEVIDSLLAKY